MVAGAVEPGEADAYHFCGHTYTTGSCPHPTGLPRIDARGYPLRARDGRPIDNLGRLDRRAGPAGRRATASRCATPTAARCRRRRGRRSASEPASATASRPTLDGAWYRCCGGHVRKLMDCCAHTRTRINGDAALTGYCYGGRKVFCVMYYQTKVPC